MHLQLPPSAEGKLVSCLRGAIYDVIVDLRPDSPTYQRQFAIELTSAEHNALYIPPLMAHGCQTLAEGTEVLYQMTDYFNSVLAFGVRWNDPALAIRWPIEDDVVILARDDAYPDFNAAQYERQLQAALSSAGCRTSNGTHTPGKPPRKPQL